MHNKLNGARHNKLEWAQIGLIRIDPVYQKQCFFQVKLSNNTFFNLIFVFELNI